MSTLASDLIQTALLSIGAIASGETPTASEQTDGLAALNRMLGSWNIDGLIVPARTIAQYPVGVSKQAYVFAAVLAPNVDFASTVPERIETCVYITAAGIRLPVRLVDLAGWTATTLYLTSGTAFPKRCYVDRSVPGQLTLDFDPAPPSGGSIEIGAWSQLAAFAAYSSSVTLRTGYDEAIIYNLARRLAPQFGVPVSPDILALATESMIRLESHNATTPVMRCDPAVLGDARRSAWNWLSGEVG